MRHIYSEFSSWRQEEDPPERPLLDYKKESQIGELEGSRTEGEAEKLSTEKEESSEESEEAESSGEEGESSIEESEEDESDANVQAFLRCCFEEDSGEEYVNSLSESDHELSDEGTEVSSDEDIEESSSEDDEESSNEEIEKEESDEENAYPFLQYYFEEEDSGETYEYQSNEQLSEDEAENDEETQLESELSELKKEVIGTIKMKFQHEKIECEHNISCHEQQDYFSKNASVYNCELCDKAFSTQGLLDYHSRDKLLHLTFPNEMTKEEISLKRKRDTNALQRYRMKPFLESGKDERWSIIEKLLITECRLRYNAQKAQHLRENIDAEQSEKLQAEINETRIMFWSLQDKWCLYRSKLRGPVSRAFDLWRSNPRWYMHQTLIKDCKERQGCCSRECGCCSERQTGPTHEPGIGHCSTGCRCCTKARGFEHSDISAKTCTKIYQNWTEKVTGDHEYMLASISGLCYDSRKDIFDMIQESSDMINVYEDKCDWS
ncbi:hypothetical protein N7495_004641 [Penicillium taxi]|uniref:uncharacterized protein n=1 Tax=Penicillium taxi TaxID=168475 RepID=UPI002545577B|nr:uncharacterized protein N7495_004641 [Penicillium taxi]KAJ5899897.1 hypothetical protein N7495_004641 [Penicillium taxi]